MTTMRRERCICRVRPDAGVGLTVLHPGCLVHNPQPTVRESAMAMPDIQSPRTTPVDAESTWSDAMIVDRAREESLERQEQRREAMSQSIMVAPSGEAAEIIVGRAEAFLAFLRGDEA